MSSKKQLLEKRINEVMGAVIGNAKGMYKSVGSILIEALKHCLDMSDGGGKGDSSLVVLIIKHMKDSEEFLPKPLIKAALDASWQIAALKFRYDTEKMEVSCKKDGKQWDSIEGDISTAALLKLENDGLIAFKAESVPRKKGTGSGKNSAVVDTIYEQPLKNCYKVVEKMKKDFPESSDLQWYLQEIASLEKELERRYDALLELKKASANKLESMTEAPALDKAS